jgi:diguanylate cyclase (GGDEF)-like protein/PAS domain S-box-containing protein
LTSDSVPGAARQPSPDEPATLCRRTEFVLRAARAGAWHWDPAANVVEASAGLRAMLGYHAIAQRETLEGWLAQVDPADRPALLTRLEAARDSGSDPEPTDLRLRAHNGAMRWFVLRAAWLQAGEQPRILLGACVDIDVLKAAHAAQANTYTALARERSRFVRILEQMPTGVVVTDMPAGRLVYQNRCAQALTGQGAHAGPHGGRVVPDFSLFRFTDHAGRRLAPDQLPLARTLKYRETTLTRDLRYCRGDGTAIDVALTTAPVYDNDGVARTAVGVMHEITARKRVERQLAAARECAVAALAAIPDGVISTSHSGAIVSMNPAAEQLVAETAAAARGRPVVDVLRFEEGEAAARLAQALARCQAERRTIADLPHATLHSPDGQRYVVECVVAPILLAGSAVDGATLVLHDVTEARRLLRRLGFEASHDALTGLVNRREFEARLQRALEHSGQPGGSPCALLYMDLDQFKIVNDTCGHNAGDELLRQLAAAYSTHVRDRDTLARLGGDEFAMIVEHCELTEAMAVAEKILDATRNFKFSCAGRVFQPGVSVGVAAVDRTTPSVEDALRRADHACYIAKERGRNQVYVHYQGDAHFAQRRGDMHWVTRLGHAFQQDQLILYCQPIMSLGDGGQQAHYEILVRLKDGHARPITPGSFLPAAERYNVILKIDRWVLARTLAWLEANPDDAERIDMCSVNLSRNSLGDAEFHRFAAELVERSPVPAGKLCFEITENGAIADMAKTRAFIDALAAHGCRFALDDFGTGITSFGYLKQLPVDFIKIDGSFIQAMKESEVDREMVRFTNDISHMMGRRTIAQYVTDPQIADQLKRIGVDFAQGYWVGRPRPLEV